MDVFTLLFWRQWECQATSAIQLVWITDCDSTRSALVRPAMGRPTDKRLGITIASLRPIWRQRAEVIGEPLVTDTVPSATEATEISRWVDTDCMLADALPKQMTPEKFVAAINTNTLSMQQPVQSIARKREKQRQGAAGKDQKK